jgi:hypothetical protein
VKGVSLYTVAGHLEVDYRLAKNAFVDVVMFEVGRVRSVAPW